MLRDVPDVETVAVDAGRSLIRVSGTIERAAVVGSLEDWAGHDEHSIQVRPGDNSQL